MTAQSFNHYAAYTAVRVVVGYRNDAGEPKRTLGTGFFCMAETNNEHGQPGKRMFLISNRHVLRDDKEQVTITLNRRKPDGTPDHGNTRTFVYEGAPLTTNSYTHPSRDVDLACLDVSDVTHTDAYSATMPSAMLEPIDHRLVAIGREVLFAGFPNNFYDEKNNLPLVRGGILASLPNVDFRGAGNVVIEATVFEGSSGSPVVVDSGDRYTLLGVLSGTWEGQIPSGENALLGFGLVVKQQYVRELIDAATAEISRILRGGS